MSAVLITKLATLIFEEIGSLQKTKAPPGTLKTNFKTSKKGGKQNITVYNEETRENRGKHEGILSYSSHLQAFAMISLHSKWLFCSFSISYFSYVCLPEQKP